MGKLERLLRDLKLLLRNLELIMGNLEPLVGNLELIMENSELLEIMIHAVVLLLKLSIFFLQLVAFLLDAEDVIAFLLDAGNVTANRFKPRNSGFEIAIVRSRVKQFNFDCLFALAKDKLLYSGRNAYLVGFYIITEIGLHIDRCNVR